MGRRQGYLLDRLAGGQIVPMRVNVDIVCMYIYQCINTYKHVSIVSVVSSPSHHFFLVCGLVLDHLLRICNKGPRDMEENFLTLLFIYFTARFHFYKV